jgi:SSS family solute:Na+ symporter
MAMAIDSIKGLKLFDVFQAILGFIAPPMSVVFLFGVLWKKTTTRAANLVLTWGTAFSLGTGVMYLWVLPSEKYDFWPHFLLLSFIIFVILSITAYLESRFGARSEETNLNNLDFGELPVPPKKVWISWTCLILTMIGLYILFNGH